MTGDTLMKKNLLALAVLALISGAAAAQSAVVCMATWTWAC